MNDLEVVETEITLPNFGVQDSLSQLLQKLSQFLETLSELTPYRQELVSFICRLDLVVKDKPQIDILKPEFVVKWDSSYLTLTSTVELQVWQAEIRNLLNHFSMGINLGSFIQDRFLKGKILNYLGYRGVHQKASVSRDWLDSVFYMKTNGTIRKRPEHLSKLPPKDKRQKLPYLSPSPEERGSEGDYFLALEALDIANHEDFVPKNDRGMGLQVYLTPERTQLLREIESIQSKKCTPGSLPEEFLRLVLIPRLYDGSEDNTVIRSVELLASQRFPYANLICESYKRIAGVPNEGQEEKKNDLPFPPSFRSENKIRHLAEWRNPGIKRGEEESKALLSSILGGKFSKTLWRLPVLSPKHPLFYGDQKRAQAYYLESLSHFRQKDSTWLISKFKTIEHLIASFLAQGDLIQAIDYLEDLRTVHPVLKLHSKISELLLRCYVELSLKKKPEPFYEWIRPRMESFLETYHDLSVTEKKRLSSEDPVASLVLFAEEDRDPYHRRLRALGYRELSEYSKAAEIYEALAEESPAAVDLVEFLEILAKAGRLDQAGPWIPDLKQVRANSVIHFFQMTEAFHEQNALAMLSEGIPFHLIVPPSEDFSVNEFLQVRHLVELFYSQGKYWSAYLLLKKFHPENLNASDQVEYYYFYCKLSPELSKNSGLTIPDQHHQLELSIATAKDDALKAMKILSEDQRPECAKRVQLKMEQLYLTIGREVPNEFIQSQGVKME